MAKYSDIKGFTVQTLSSDTAASQAAAGSWSSGGSLNSARRGLAGSGSTTAALAFGGTVTASSALTEQYNGSSWSEEDDLNTARRNLASSVNGSTTASSAFAGYSTANSALHEQYNGSSWSEEGDLTIARNESGGCGTTTAALSFGGETPLTPGSNAHYLIRHQ